MEKVRKASSTRIFVRTLVVVVDVKVAQAVQIADDDDDDVREMMGNEKCPAI